MANREIDNLRREANNRARAASRKIQRLRSQGIVVGGSEFDPRREASKVNRYNSTQVKAYINRLNEFTNRNTKFVALSGGQPATASEARRFERTMQQYNQFVGQYRQSFSGIPVGPKNNATVEDLNRRTSGDWKTFAAGRSAQRPIAEAEHNIAHINGREKLKVLEKGMRDRMKGDYLNKRIEDSRDQGRQMLTQIGADTPLQKMFDSLNDFQFNVLWHEMELAESLAQIYTIIKNANVREIGAMADDATEDFVELIQWGLGISPLGQEPTGDQKNPNSIKLHTSTKGGAIAIYTDTRAKPINLPKNK